MNYQFACSGTLQHMSRRNETGFNFPTEDSVDTIRSADIAGAVSATTMSVSSFFRADNMLVKTKHEKAASLGVVEASYDDLVH